MNNKISHWADFSRSGVPQCFVAMASPAMLLTCLNGFTFMKQMSMGFAQ